MIDEELQKEILKSISLYGSADESTAISKPVIGGNLNHILNLNSGSPRINNNVVKRFELIINQPFSLQALNALEIRCCLCCKVIHYPCWYYKIAYAVNVFHYFVCLDGSSPEKVNAKCYKR